MPAKFECPRWNECGGVFLRRRARPSVHLQAAGGALAALIAPGGALEGAATVDVQLVNYGASPADRDAGWGESLNAPPPAGARARAASATSAIGAAVAAAGALLPAPARKVDALLGRPLDSHMLSLIVMRTGDVRRVARPP